MSISQTSVGVLQSKECQKWLRKRYRVRANINYLWQAHELYDQEQLSQLFNTVLLNSPEIYKSGDDLEFDDEEAEIDLEAFYKVMKKQGGDQFMDRKTFDKVIQLIDRDGNRKLNRNEFYTMLMSRTIVSFFQKLNKESFEERKKSNPISQPPTNGIQPSTVTAPLKPSIHHIPAATQNISNTSDSKPESHFEFIDMPRLIGTLKYSSERDNLIKQFNRTRKDKAVDISKKYQNLKEIINLPNFSVDNIGVSVTESCFTKQQMTEFRRNFQKKASSSGQKPSKSFDRSSINSGNSIQNTSIIKNYSIKRTAADSLSDLLSSYAPIPIKIQAPSVLPKRPNYSIKHSSHSSYLHQQGNNFSENLEPSSSFKLKIDSVPNKIDSSLQQSTQSEIWLESCKVPLPRRSDPLKALSKDKIIRIKKTVPNQIVSQLTSDSLLQGFLDTQKQGMLESNKDNQNSDINTSGILSARTPVLPNKSFSTERQIRQKRAISTLDISEQSKQQMQNQTFMKRRSLYLSVPVDASHQPQRVKILTDSWRTQRETGESFLKSKQGGVDIDDSFSITLSKSVNNFAASQSRFYRAQSDKMD